MTNLVEHLRNSSTELSGQLAIPQEWWFYRTMNTTVHAIIRTLRSYK